MKVKSATESCGGMTKEHSHYGEHRNALEEGQTSQAVLDETRSYNGSSVTLMGKDKASAGAIPRLKSIR